MKLNLKYLVAALALSVSVTSFASEEVVNDVHLETKAPETSELRVYTGAKTIHYKHNDTYNNNNPTIGVEYNDVTLLYTSKNSYGDASVYLMYTPEMYETEHVELGFAVGVASGYKKKGEYKGRRYRNPVLIGDVLPVFGGTVTYKITENTSAGMLVTPMFSTFVLSHGFNL